MDGLPRPNIPPSTRDSSAADPLSAVDDIINSITDGPPFSDRNHLVLEELNTSAADLLFAVDGNVDLITNDAAFSATDSLVSEDPSCDGICALSAPSFIAADTRTTQMSFAEGVCWGQAACPDSVPCSSWGFTLGKNRNAAPKTHACHHSLTN